MLQGKNIFFFMGVKTLHNGNGQFLVQSWEDSRRDECKQKKISFFQKIFIEPPSPTPGLHRHYNHPSISIIFPKNAQI